jgi:putative transposase
MIDCSHALPVAQRCKVLSLSRSTAYYQRQEIGEADLSLMRRLVELHLERPFAGSRMLRDVLKAERYQIRRKHVATLMKKMGVTAPYRKPNTSPRCTRRLLIPAAPSAHRTAEPCLGRRYQLHSDKCGFVYLFAVMDWASRRVLAWQLSNTLTTDFCIEAVQLIMARLRSPTRTRAAGLPVASSCNCSKTMAFPSV